MFANREKGIRRNRKTFYNAFKSIYRSDRMQRHIIIPLIAYSSLMFFIRVSNKNREVV